MADRFAPDELPNSLPALLTLHSDLRRFMSEEKPAADEKLRRCVTLRAAVKTVATEVGRCRLTVLKSLLKSPMCSVLETII
jgi:hypothetical protein